MFLNTDYKRVPNDFVLPGVFEQSNKVNIYYVQSQRDVGHYKIGVPNFELSLLSTSVTQNELLSLIVLMKTFRIIGSKIKCERLLKNDKLTYSISIYNCLFVEVDFETRKIIKIVENFEFKSKEQELLLKEKTLQIANFIEESVFIDKLESNEILVNSPLNEQKDYENWFAKFGE